MKHEKTFRALATTFNDPDTIDDCTDEMYRSNHEDDDECGCEAPKPIDVSCGELRCRTCGRRVG